MPIGGDVVDRDDLHLIHYNLAFKPWHFENILYKEYFWKCAKKTEYFDQILKIQSEYTDEDKFKDRESDKKLRELAQKECDCVGDDRAAYNYSDTNIPKAKDRLEILDKIKRLEREGRFDIDVENDPPTIVLTPENVDYLNKKETSKIKTKVANTLGKRFIDELLKNNKLIIKEVNGIENLDSVETGAMITCNHFNPFDSFAIEKTFRMSKQAENKKLYKVDEYVIAPLVHSHNTSVTPLWALFSIFAFSGLFGIVGLVIAIPGYLALRVIYLKIRSFDPVEDVE